MRFGTSLLGVVWLSACIGEIGGDDGVNPPPPPQANPVAMTVQDGGVPQAGVRVLFQHPDGKIDEVKTDASGKASAAMPDGGDITVIRTYPATVQPPRPSEVYTYVGVQAGDQLRLGHEVNAGTPTAINVVVPAALQGTVTVNTPCGSGQGTAPTIPLTVTGCPATMVVYATDQTDAVYKQLPYMPNLDLSTQPLANTLPATLTAKNVSATTQVTAELRLFAGMFGLYTSGPQQIAAAAANVDLPNLSGVEELLVGTFAAPTYNEVVARRDAYQITPKFFDASVGMIPFVTNPTYAPSRVTWTEQGPGTADFALAVLDVQRGGVQTPDAHYIRAVVAAHTGASLAIPQLTGADAMYNPAAADQITGKSGIAAITGGYAAARAYVFSVASPYEIAPTGGMVTVSYAGQLPTL